jgi:hypothetical protein
LGCMQGLSGGIDGFFSFHRLFLSFLPIPIGEVAINRETNQRCSLNTRRYTYTVTALFGLLCSPIFTIYGLWRFRFYGYRLSVWGAIRAALFLGMGVGLCIWALSVLCPITPAY